jgi:hypothetical protein
MSYAQKKITGEGIYKCRGPEREHHDFFSDAQVLEHKLSLLVELSFSVNYILRFVYTSVP